MASGFPAYSNNSPNWPRRNKFCLHITDSPKMVEFSALQRQKGCDATLEILARECVCV